MCCWSAMGSKVRPSYNSPERNKKDGWGAILMSGTQTVDTSNGPGRRYTFKFWSLPSSVPLCAEANYGQ
jgi:hypothetical protein